MTTGGSPNNITPEAYENMSEGNRDWYAPEYLKYRTKKVRSYETCDLGHDHFRGWVEESTPIGEPYRYRKVNSFQHMLNATIRLTTPSVIDSLNSSNILMDRITKRPQA